MRGERGAIRFAHAAGFERAAVQYQVLVRALQRDGLEVVAGRSEAVAREIEFSGDARVQ